MIARVNSIRAARAAGELVAGGQHRHAGGEQHADQEVALLPLPQGDHLGVVGRPLGAAVPGAVVVAAVAVVLAVGLVVLLVVADQVVEGEAVVSGDEVDAGVGTAAVRLVQVRGAGEPVGDVGHAGLGATPEVANGVPVAPVPLGPAHREVAHLVAAHDGFTLNDL